MLTTFILPVFIKKIGEKCIIWIASDLTAWIEVDSTLWISGMPKIDKMEIEGRGYHTNLYVVWGIYSGGKEGKRKIQWLTSMVGSLDLISIPGMESDIYSIGLEN